jgi:ankyrin repeat protein/energy-coupling factor transporter ATP-binding protein EcfA2
MSKWKEQHMNFIETNASKVIFETVNTQKCVAIVGPPGSGMSNLAYNTAGKMEKEKGYAICICKNTSDIIHRIYPSHNAKVLFVFDDVIGKFAVNEDAMESWEQYSQDISDLLSKYTDMKILLTCRLYIYKLTRLDCMKNISPSYCKLLSDELKLTLGERREILKSYTNVAEIDDDVALMYNFFPLMRSMLDDDDKQKDILDFFKRPDNVLQLEINHLKKKSEIVYFSLALLVILNNNVEKSMLDINDNTNDILLQDLFDELEFKQRPSKTLLRSCMFALRDTYVKETETSFTFLHEPLFEVISYCIGENIINCIIKYADSSFIKNRIQFLFWKRPHDKLTIMLKDNDNLQKLYFDRLLTDIKKGLNWDVFNNGQIKFPEYRRLFKDYLEKQLKPEDLTSGPDGSTALHVVSDQGFDEFVFMFIDLDNTMINKKNSSGKTALHLASSKGYTKVAQMLITYKADTAPLDNDNLTPLREACKNGHVDTVELLLDRTHNQKKTWVSINKVHILHTVCENGHTNMIKKILKFDVDVNIKTEEECTPLYLACNAGHYDTVLMLLEECKANINSTDKKGKTPLFIVCEKNRETIVHLLLAKGASVDKTDQHGSTALHISCSLGFENISENLLQKGASINKKDCNGNTPLYEACRGGHQNVIYILINHKVDVNNANKSGSTPLMISCAKGNTKVVRLLLEKDAIVNQCDAESLTPLHIACQGGFTEVVKVLLQWNAMIDICDKDGCTPLYFARKQNYPEIVEHLLKNKGSLSL